MGKVFVPSELAHSVLQRLRRANAGLEEMKHGNIQRECREEVCTYEEAREAFENDEKTRRFWEEYVREASPSTGLGLGGVQSLYLILPLLGGLLLIAVVMVAVWRCHSRKVFEGRSAFGHPHQDPSLPREGVDQQGRSYHPNLTPPLGLSPHNSPIHLGSELASGRADGGEPPPSYEEAVGQTDVRVHVDPPPQYEEIINSASIAGK